MRELLIPFVMIRGVKFSKNLRRRYLSVFDKNRLCIAANKIISPGRPPNPNIFNRCAVAHKIYSVEWLLYYCFSHKQCYIIISRVSYFAGALIF